MKSKQQKTVLTPELVITRILEFADKALERVITENNHQSVCTKGCSYCCRQPVFITPLEALAVSLAVSKMDLQKRDRLQQRIHYYTEIVHTTPNMEDGVYATQMELCGFGDGPTKPQFAALYGPDCPFLENNLCSIYDSRPLMCREHTSLDDPSKCEKDEPFFGLPAALFNEVPAALCRDFVPDEMIFVPVWQYEIAAEATHELPPIEEAFLETPGPRPPCPIMYTIIYYIGSIDDSSAALVNGH